MSRHFKVGDIVQYVLGPRQPGETITYEVTYEVSHVNSDTGLIKLKGYSSWTQPRYYRLVNHTIFGKWEGEVTFVNNTGEGIEYEVSNSPEDMAKHDPIFKQPGHRWFPLLWECEIVRLL